jgi:hypothetical protein
VAQVVGGDRREDDLWRVGSMRQGFMDKIFAAFSAGRGRFPLQFSAYICRFSEMVRMPDFGRKLRLVYAGF